MKRAHIAFGVLALAGLLLAWNALLFGPKSKERKEVKEQVASARSENDDLRAELEGLRRAKDHQEADQAALDRIRQLMPSDDDMADFIRSMDELAVRTRVDWASLSPSTAAPAPGQKAGTINISISVSGSFFELLDYLDGLAALDRLVVIDSAQISGSGVNPDGGELRLEAALSGRIFSASSGGGGAEPPAGTEEASETVAAASPGTGGN